MHDPANRLRRIPLPRTPVNKGKKPRGRVPVEPRPATQIVDALLVSHLHCRACAHHLAHDFSPLLQRSIPVEYGANRYQTVREERILDHYAVQGRLVRPIEDAETPTAAGEELEGLHVLPVGVPPGGESLEQGREDLWRGKELRFDQDERTHDSLCLLTSLPFPADMMLPAEA